MSTAASSPPLSDRAPALVNLRRLVADGRHNAFTDLFRWGDALYLTYRRSSGHGRGDGDIVLLRSTDGGETWSDVPTGLRQSHNFYEGHMAALHGRLFMYGGSYCRADKLDKSTKQQMVSCSDDGLTWSAAQPACAGPWRFWRPITLGQRLFVAAYQVDYSMLGPDGRIDDAAWTVVLMASDDGLNWREISDISRGMGGNETQLCADPDGTLHAYTRRETAPGHLMHASSRPPYTQWTPPRDRGMIVQGQIIADIHGRRFMIGRHRQCSDTYGTIFERRDTISTRIWVLERGYWVDYLTLPSGGDCSYAGIASLDDRHMLVSYYSQHAYVDQPGFEDMDGPSDIYLAKVRTDQPAMWGRLTRLGREALAKP